MAYPMREGQFYLDCDSSDVSIGAVFSQIHGHVDREEVIAYGSWTLNWAVRNYCMMDHKCLTVKHFCGHYKHYLLGHGFIMCSNHQTMLWLLSMKEPKGMARWIKALSPFQFVIQFQKGIQHVNTDGMSRRPKP